MTDGDPERTGQTRDEQREEFFTALSHPRRRRLVLLLAMSPDRMVTLREAAQLIAIAEDGLDVDTRQVTNVRTSLKRSHQQPLEAAAIVAFDTGQVIADHYFDTALRTVGIATV